MAVVGDSTDVVAGCGVEGGEVWTEQWTGPAESGDAKVGVGVVMGGKVDWPI